MNFTPIRKQLTKQEVLNFLARCKTGNQMLSTIDNLKFNGFIK